MAPDSSGVLLGCPATASGKNRPGRRRAARGSRLPQVRALLPTARARETGGPTRWGETVRGATGARVREMRGAVARTGCGAASAPNRAPARRPPRRIRDRARDVPRRQRPAQPTPPHRPRSMLLKSPGVPGGPGGSHLLSAAATQQSSTQTFRDEVGRRCCDLALSCRGTSQEHPQTVPGHPSPRPPPRARPWAL